MANPVLDRERADFLEARDSRGKVLVPAWPRSEKELRLVEVEVTWVRFSTLNHRTRAEQMREIARTGRPDLFTADPLGQEAQDAQYRILSCQEGFDALKADLRERGQQDPAILTGDGILINGNRRAAALRSLFRDDDFHQARYMRCLVLPQDAEPAELLDLEAELQVARDFKQEYSWINEALLIEELYDREGKDFGRVATRMHRDMGDVRALHEKLQQVHQLVALSDGARLHVDFNDNESAFDELAKHIKNKPPEEADSVRSVYFLGTLANVKYRKLRHLRRADAAALVRREIEADASLQPLLVAVESETTALESDPLDDILGSGPEPTPLNALLGYLAAQRPEATISLPDGESVTTQAILDTLQSAITAAADEAEEEQRDQTAVTAPLVRADKAIAELERAITALPKARKFAGWDSTAMSGKLTKLEELLKQLKASQ